ncbi:MAG: phage tail tape measure protein [Eubacterium sp.]|nr:phage tail tape measure protein [Eubacterium sp.]
MSKNINVTLTLQDKYTGRLSAAAYSTLLFEKRLTAAKTVASGFKSVMNSMERVATGVAAGVVGAGVALTKEALSAYGEYEEALNRVAAVQGIEAQTAAYKDLNDQIKETAKSVKATTYTDVAEAEFYMSLAGWRDEEIEVAAKPVLQAIKISEGDTQEVSDALTDSMTALGVSAKYAQEYVDLATAVQSSTNTDMLSLQNALIKDGPAYMAVYENSALDTMEKVKDIMGITGALASAGVKDTQSGTAVNTIINRLFKGTGEAQKGLEMLGVSMYDDEGKAKGMLQVFTDISDAVRNLGGDDETRLQALSNIGGARNTANVTTLINAFNTLGEDGKTAIDKVNEAMAESEGAADRYLETFYSGSSGSLEQLSAEWANFKTDLGEMIAPYAIEYIDYIRDKLPMALEWADEHIPIIADKVGQLCDTAESIAKWLSQNGKQLLTALGTAYVGMGLFRGGVSAIDTINKLGKFFSLGKVAGGAGSAAAGGLFGGAGSAGVLGSVGAILAPTVVGLGAAGIGAIAVEGAVKAGYVDAFKELIGELGTRYGEFNDWYENSDTVFHWAFKGVVETFVGAVEDTGEAIAALGIATVEVAAMLPHAMGEAKEAMISAILNPSGDENDPGGEYKQDYGEVVPSEAAEALAGAGIGEIGAKGAGEKLLDSALGTAGVNFYDYLKDKVIIRTDATYGGSNVNSVWANKHSGYDWEASGTNYEPEPGVITVPSYYVPEEEKEKTRSIIEAYKSVEEAENYANELEREKRKAVIDAYNSAEEVTNSAAAGVEAGTENVVGAIVTMAGSAGEATTSSLSAQEEAAYNSGLAYTGKVADGMSAGAARVLAILNGIGDTARNALETVLQVGGVDLGSYLGGSGGSGSTEGNALGTNYFSGGVTAVNENGYEIMDLPKGTRVIPHQKSRQIVEGRNGGIAVYVNVENIYGEDERMVDRIGNTIAEKLAEVM